MDLEVGGKYGAQEVVVARADGGRIEREGWGGRMGALFGVTVVTVVVVTAVTVGGGRVVGRTVRVGVVAGRHGW